MVIDFSSTLCIVGDACFNERVALELGRPLCWQKKGKRLQKLFLYTFFGPFRGREIRVFENCESLD